MLWWSLLDSLKRPWLLPLHVVGWLMVVVMVLGAVVEVVGKGITLAADWATLWVDRVLGMGEES